MAESSIVPRLSLLFSILALAGAAVAVAGSWRSRPRAAEPVPNDETEDLERRLTVLERQVELVRVGTAVRSVAQGKEPPATAPVAGGPPPGMAELDQRVAQLE